MAERILKLLVHHPSMAQLFWQAGMKIVYLPPEFSSIRQGELNNLKRDWNRQMGFLLHPFQVLWLTQCAGSAACCSQGVLHYYRLKQIHNRNSKEAKNALRRVPHVPQLQTLTSNVTEVHDQLERQGPTFDPDHGESKRVSCTL